MRRAVCGLAAAVVLAACGSAVAGQIAWAPSYEAAVKKAKAVKKPLMIDLYTDWCGWCKKLDSDVYNKDEVIELSKEFVCLKLNPEKDKKNGKKFQVEGFPTIFFLDSAGKEINKIVGFRPADKFAAEMKKALEAAKGKSKE